MSSYDHKLMMIEQEQETENSTENSSDNTPRCTASIDTKIASTSSSKRRRATEKRVISVPIKDIEGFRVKGDHISVSAPPSDSWAWRKYGQKPIKGSPYPRGYYRCSSSKGCPARKQVERSRSDPNSLLITYSCEHNHSSSMIGANSRNHHHHSRSSHVIITHSNATSAVTGTAMSVSEEDEEAEDYYEEEEDEKKPVVNKDLLSDAPQESQEQAPPPEYKFSAGLGCAEGAAGEFGWFDFEPTPYGTVLDQCPILTDGKCISNTDSEMATIFTRREEEESLFAGLGELPECSKVFRREMDWREVAA